MTSNDTVVTDRDTGNVGDGIMGTGVSGQADTQISDAFRHLHKPLLVYYD
jgi:hypothetical protein